MKPSRFGFRKNWPLNMMNKLLKTMALGQIRNNDFSGEEEEDDDDQDTTDEAPSMNKNLQELAHIYRSEDDVKLRYQQHEPLSIVVTNYNIFGCLI
jgi:hypothetical protein